MYLEHLNQTSLEVINFFMFNSAEDEISTSHPDMTEKLLTGI